jgi:hypothetical protein
MSEPASILPPPKARWFLLGIAFLLGCVASAYVFWMDLDITDMDMIKVTGCCRARAVFPPFCSRWCRVAAASRWFPVIGAALIWELLHHLVAAKCVLEIAGGNLGSSFSRMRSPICSFMGQSRRS